jgi:hypothetical protein
MKKFVEIVIAIPFALAFGLFYGLVADKLTKGREPWFTLFMVLGLGMTVCVMRWLCGASWAAAVWVFIGTGILFVASRLMFGKGSAHEMIIGPHICVILILALHPALERAKEKARHIREEQPNQSPEPTAVGAVSSAIAVHVASRRWLSFHR